MSGELIDFVNLDRTLEDENTMTATMLSGVTEISTLAPLEAMTSEYCHQLIHAFQKTHRHGERVDLAKVAAAQGKGNALELMTFVRNWAVSADEGMAIARLLRQRYEGGILASELETNLSLLRYGFEAVEAAQRCQAAIDQYQRSITGEGTDTSIQAILQQHGGRLLGSRQEGGLPFNLPSFDKHIGGLHPGELIVFAARPKRGKSMVLARRVYRPLFSAWK